MPKTSPYKYLFFIHYGKIKQSGISELSLKQTLIEGLGIRIETLRKWEKLSIKDDFSLSKAEISFICKTLECEESEFVNETETAII